MFASPARRIIDLCHAAAPISYFAADAANPEPLSYRLHFKAVDASWARTSDGHSDRSSLAVFVLFAIVATAMVVGSLALSWVVGQPEPEHHVITIPAGTSISISLGHDVDIIPADLESRLRDQLTGINEDSTAHRIGPFIIPAGDRLDTKFAEAATVEGFCSLHSSGRITINVGET